MPLSTFTSLLHVVLLATAASLQFTHMETGKFSMRNDFRAGEQVKGDVYHEVVFAVKQKNLDQLEKIFYEVSDPKNPRYGKYLTRQQVADLSSNMAGTQAVSKFLMDQGVTIVKTSPYGEYITAMAPVATWNTLFDTTFAEYHNLEGKRNTVLRCPHYSLPTDLVEHVEGVFNTVQLPPRVPIRSFASSLAKARSGLNTTAGAGTVTPAFLNSYYHITSNTGNTLSTQSLFESLGQYYSPADLSQFQTQYNLPQQAVSENIGEQGPNDQACQRNANNCIEANLDVQYIMAVAQVNPTTYWYDGSADSFLNWIQAVAADPDPPLVHSISYGALEDQMPTLPLTRFNQEAMKLGTQGITITVSSGDDGVANFNARGDPSQCGYHPSFPATSPYVTAIGATQGPESGNPEIACQSNEKGIITTGGGFSTVFTAPSWQTATISNYFKVATAPASGYSTTGRGYPDIAMAGFNYEVVVGGDTLAVSGTSASSPVVAGMVALVNAARLAAGKPALGFLNQAIYQFGTKFTNDITSGENNCAASSVPATATCCTEGFYAAAGWDPLTGFGSVDYAKFYQTFYNL